MSHQLLPYEFVPIYKHVLWGGDRIARFKGEAVAGAHVGESWELSGLPGHESVVALGPERGLTLPQLIAKHGEHLLGRRVTERYGTRFPLLFKFIDAKRDLSVQVHPGDDMARRHHGAAGGKAEMWYVIDAEPNAQIVAGLSREITPSDYERLVAEKRIMDVVATHRSHAGDVFYLPPGRIHSIGAGNLLAEVQQACDITYRVYDYDRRDADGHPRELHVDLAREAIDYTVATDYRATPSDLDANGARSLVQCDHFKVSLVNVTGECPLPRHNDAFTVIMCVAGECRLISAGGLDMPLRRGHTILIPASAPQIDLTGQATTLITTL